MCLLGASFGSRLRKNYLPEQCGEHMARVPSKKVYTTTR